MKKRSNTPDKFSFNIFKDRMLIFQNKWKLKVWKESISENLTTLHYDTLKAYDHPKAGLLQKW